MSEANEKTYFEEHSYVGNDGETMMKFEDQMIWIENKIAELEKTKEKGDSKRFKSSEAERMQRELSRKIESDINVLKIIMADYRDANKDSVYLDWINFPDRMGQ